MVNPLTTLSIVSLYVETLLIAYMAAQLYGKAEAAYFITFLLLIVISYVLTSTSSALMVRTSMDFSGRYPGKALCFALHLCQLSLAWRFGKLVLLYDRKDWFELTSLRLIHIAVQSLPFLAIQGYMTFSSTMDINAVSILALAVALMSASISLTLFCVREQLHSCSWREANDVSSSSTKKYCGVFLLLVGTTLALSARFACIVLMSRVVYYFVFIPIVFHMLILVFGYMSCKAVKSKSIALKDVLARIGLSYLNIFDLVERDIQRVQCKYVSFYTVILIENIVMVAVWLLKSDEDYITKLIVIVIILALFICALVLKFASCGFITTPSNSHLLQSDAPDNATVTEGKNIIKTSQPIPAISADVPHVLNNETVDVQTQLGNSNVDTLTVIEPSSRSAPRIKPKRGGRGVTLGSKFKHTVSTDPRITNSTTDYGTYRTGTETQDSYSLDDPTHVSRYASHDSCLVFESRTAGKTKGQIHIPTSTNHRVRERSEVSLDLCSSNSRNTNTLMTSVMETSQTSGVHTPNINVSNHRDKKIIFPLGKMSSRWTKFNLRLPSVSNFLVRSRGKTFKPYSVNTMAPASHPWCDSETVSTSTAAFENNMHKKTTGNTTSASVTEVTENTSGPADPLPTKVMCKQSVRGQQLTPESRVQLWLADIKRSKPIPACQCSSESHSSDCTYVPPPKTKVQDVPKFEDFLANVPPHPEESFVVSSEQSVKPPIAPKPKLKPKSSRRFPILEPPTQHSHQFSNLISPSEKQKHVLANSPERRKQGSSSKTIDKSCEQRHRPKSSMSKLESDSLVQTGPTKRRRSFSDPSDSTAVLELEPGWLSDNQSPNKSDNEPVVPFIIKLGAMESLV